MTEEELKALMDANSIPHHGKTERELRKMCREHKLYNKIPKREMGLLLHHLDYKYIVKIEIQHV